MNKFKKCFSALFLSCFLAFGNVSGCYLEVQAFEWVVPAIGIEEALKGLLMLLGVSVGAKVGSEVDWGQLKEDCIQFQENQGNSAVAVSNWWNDVISGELNQASDCWTSFKAWVSSLVNKFKPDNIITDNSFSNICSIYNSKYNISLRGSSSSNASTPIYGALLVSYSASRWEFFAFKEAGEYSIIQSGNNLTVAKNGISYSGYYLYSASWDYGSISSPVNTFRYSFNKSIPLHTFNMSWDSSFSNIDSIGGLGLFGKINVLVNDKINDFSLALQDAISSAIPDVIPLPWDQLGDTTDAIENYLEGLIDAVNEGVLSLEDAMVKLQDALGVMSIDTTTDIIYPTNPDKPDETLQDKVEENQANGTFVLGGFEKVFPFCIPFDIYAFMTLLVAEPVAPIIRYPIYNPVTKENNEIVLDFSEWESVTILFRYIFDFLFIIGLLLSARALIGGGDKA